MVWRNSLFPQFCTYLYVHTSINFNLSKRLSVINSEQFPKNTEALIKISVWIQFLNSLSTLTKNRRKRKEKNKVKLKPKSPGFY